MRPRLLGALSLLACLLPFAPGLNGPFVLDDVPNLLQARTAGSSLTEYIDAIFRNESGLLRRPISNLSFVLNLQLLGPDAFGFKLVNLAVHFAVAIALWALAARALPLLYPAINARQASWTGLLAAVIWAVHPIQVSTVLYIVQRMAQLSTLLLAVALAYALCFVVRSREATLTDGLKAVVVTGFAAFAALLAKENGALFPLLLLTVFLSADRQSRQLFVDNLGQRLFFSLTCWAPLALGAVVVVATWDWLTAGYAGREFSLAQRVLTEPFVLAHYARTILIPDIRQMGLYLDDIPVRGPEDAIAWIAFFLAIAIPMIAIALRSWAPAISFAVLWFYAAHALESTFLPLEIAFEHRNYLALFGPALAAAHYLGKIAANTSQRTALAIIGLLALTLSTATLSRSHQWSRADLMARGEVRHHPLSPRAQIDAAILDAETGNQDAALERVRAVQDLRPNNFWPLSLDISLACDLPEHPVQWERMEQQVRAAPQELSITHMLRVPASRVQAGNCPFLDVDRFDRLLASATQIFRSQALPLLAERALMLRSSLAQGASDYQQAKRLLAEGAELNPEGTTALYSLAYLALNSGDLETTSNAVAEIEQRSRSFADSYRLEELRQQLATARASDPPLE